ncbi:MAG: ABC transporter ATP-binding protein [Elainellaceae cyanobacterium]
MSHLSLNHLTKRFQDVTAVQDIWLQVQSGEIVSLLGPSGCGKSTTLQLIAGVLRPDIGTVELDGRVLNRISPEKRDIALVLQQGLLFPHLSVGENVAFGLKMRGVSRVDRDQEAIAMLKRVHLDGFADRKPSELSGGQAQRVAVARSLVIRPMLLLLDEPLSALDANLREDMQEMILQLQAQTEVTMMVVTHDQSEAVVMSDRIAVMFDGCLRQVDTPETLYRQPCDDITARFMGGVNFFTAEAQGRQWHVSEEMTLMSPYSHHGLIQVTIRPEHIQVSPEPISHKNCIEMTVVRDRFTGTQRRLTLSTYANLSLQAWIAPNQTFSIGQTVWAYLPAEALWYFPSETAVMPPVEVS